MKIGGLNDRSRGTGRAMTNMSCHWFFDLTARSHAIVSVGSIILPGNFCRPSCENVEAAGTTVQKSIVTKTWFSGAAAFCMVIASASALPSLAAPAPANGETLFRQKCQACHSVVAAKPAGVGPNLRGVVGRKAAATAFNYSTALKQSKITWNQENLERYLAAPPKMVPGTRMVISVTDASQRAVLIKYLSQTK